MNSLIKTVNEAGNLKNLVRIIQKSGFIQNLSNDGQYTIFAPNDNAFLNIESNYLENLLNDKDRLLSVLKTHIIGKKINTQSLNNLKKIKTINGKELNISTKTGLQINDSNIVKSDIQCTNGIIHVIDKVIILKK